jgi:hypothetical protein
MKRVFDDFVAPLAISIIVGAIAYLISSKF